MKTNKKRIDLFDVFRGRFLVPFWSKTGPQGGPGGPQKSEKEVNKTVPGILGDFFGFRPALRDRFLRISGQLFNDFNESRGFP